MTRPNERRVRNHRGLPARAMHEICRAWRRLNLRYTFFSVQKKKPDTIMKIDVLRDAGIGDILVEFDIITEDENIALENKYAYEE